MEKQITFVAQDISKWQRLSSPATGGALESISPYTTTQMYDRSKTQLAQMRTGILTSKASKVDLPLVGMDLSTNSAG